MVPQKPKGIVRCFEESDLLDFMTDASKIKNVVAADVESTPSDEENYNDYNEAPRSVKRRIEQRNNIYFM